MKVYKITEEQVDHLRGQIMSTGATYNVENIDADGYIIISKEQFNECGIGVEIDFNPVEVSDEETIEEE